MAGYGLGDLFFLEPWEEMTNRKPDGYIGYDIKKDCIYYAFGFKKHISSVTWGANIIQKPVCLRGFFAAKEIAAAIVEHFVDQYHNLN